MALLAVAVPQGCTVKGIFADHNVLVFQDHPIQFNRIGKGKGIHFSQASREDDFTDFRSRKGIAPYAVQAFR